jgi:hypothetical protein
MQVASERRETADGVWISISAHCDVQLAGANINACGIWVQDR